MKNILIILWIGCLSTIFMPSGTQAQRLVVSGFLGQSQPLKTKPLGFKQAHGAAIDPAGGLWTVAGNMLYRFTRHSGGQWICRYRVRLPAGAVSNVMDDGRCLFVVCRNGDIYAIAPRAGAKPQTVVTGIKVKGARGFAVAPAGLDKGFAASGKLFMLKGDAVDGFTADGKHLGAVLTMGRPTNPNKNPQIWYRGVAVEPHSGHLLVAGYWPDQRIYCFNRSGQQMTTDGWPRTKIGVQTLFDMAGSAWAATGGGLMKLPLLLSQQRRSQFIKGLWTDPVSGGAIDTSGRIWMACHQGLVRFDRQGHSTRRRLGGLPGIGYMAVTPTGELCATVSGNRRLIRLWGDGPADAELTCKGDPYWTVGKASGSHQAVGLAWSGKKFLVLDATTRQLWQFDPWHASWHEGAWKPITKPETFNHPRALTAGAAHWYVLDNNRLICGNYEKIPSITQISILEINIKSILAISIVDGCHLLLATHHKIYLFSPSRHGFKMSWARSLDGSIAAIAGSQNFVAVVDKKENRLIVLNAENGKPLAQIGAGRFSRGWRPAAIAVMRSWLFIADAKNDRIIRLHFTVDH